MGDEEWLPQISDAAHHSSDESESIVMSQPKKRSRKRGPASSVLKLKDVPPVYDPKNQNSRPKAGPASGSQSHTFYDERQKERAVKIVNEMSEVIENSTTKRMLLWQKKRHTKNSYWMDDAAMAVEIIKAHAILQRENAALRARVRELRSESRKRQRTPTVVNHTTNYQQVNHNTNVFTTMGSWVSKLLGKVSSGAAVPALPAPTQEQQHQHPVPSQSQVLVTRTTETRNATISPDDRVIVLD